MCLKKRASFYLNLELKYWSSKLEEFYSSLYELDGEAKKLDAQSESHKVTLEVNNSVVSVQTVLCVRCTIYVTVSILCH